MTIREFRKNLSQYLKQLRKGETLCVGDLFIGRVKGSADVDNRVHHPTCPCFACHPPKK